MLSILEMIKSGTTTFVDMYSFMDDVARAVEESGMRAVLARGVIGIGPNGEAALHESVNFAGNWHGKADGRITTMLAPHAPYTCPPDYLKRSWIMPTSWAPVFIFISGNSFRGG